MENKVKTSKGYVNGFTENGINKWLGIPYAKAPIGALRFKRATEADPWDEVLECNKFRQIPYQFSSAYFNSPLPESEDCLKINVQRKNDNQNKLPVFVWIYGGGWDSGFASEPTYDGEHFANCDIVHVTFDYRLGPLGFYNFSLLDNENFDSNCALSDYLAALKWVKANIEAFWGDADNITIAGESAGGSAVAALLSTPKSEGLFQKAIVQSGSGDLAYYDTDTTKKLLDVFFEKCHVHNSRDLYKLPATEMKAGAAFIASERTKRHVGILPPAYVKDDLMPFSPTEAIRRGISKNVKVILGTCKDEGTLFYQMLKTNPQNWDDFNKLCEESNLTDICTNLKNYYESESAEMQQMSMLSTDLNFRLGSGRLAEEFAKNDNFWTYQFDYAPKAMKDRGLGATHGVDIAVTLGNAFGTGYDMFWKGNNPDDFNTLRSQIGGAWINFIKFGDPNGTLPISWPKYSQTSKKTLVLNNQMHIEDNIYEDMLSAWSNHLPYND